MKKLVVIVTIASAIALAPSSAQAQFGFNVVYDPTNFHNAVLRYYQLVAQLNQMRATYAQILNQYNLAMQMSKNLPNMATRYATSWAPWRYANAQDVYGNATLWVKGANSGIVPNVLSGYQKATNTFLSYPQAILTNMPSLERQRIQSYSATIEIRDEAAQNALQTIGAIRANAVSAVNTIGNIKHQSFYEAL